MIGQDLEELKLLKYEYERQMSDLQSVRTFTLLKSLADVVELIFYCQ